MGTLSSLFHIYLSPGSSNTVNIRTMIIILTPTLIAWLAYLVYAHSPAPRERPMMLKEVNRNSVIHSELFHTRATILATIFLWTWNRRYRMAISMKTLQARGREPHGTRVPRVGPIQ